MKNADFEVVSGEEDIAGAEVAVFAARGVDVMERAQATLRAQPSTQIVFLATASELGRLRQSLPFVPSLSLSWTADLDGQPEALAAILQKAAEGAQLRSATNTLLSRINARLGEPPGTDAADAAQGHRLRQLALAEDYVATLVSQAPDGLIALSLAGVILAWNEAATRIFDRSAERAVGSDSIDVLPATVMVEVEGLMALAAAGEASITKQIQLAASPAPRWLELSVSPIRDESEAVGTLLLTVRDISDQKAIEDALRESRGYLRDVLASSGEAFYAVDREGTTTLCNQAFLKLLGFASEGDVLGRKLHDLIHHSHPNGSHYDKQDCPIYICASTGEAAHVEDECFFRVDGVGFPVEYWVNPVFRDGVHHGAICSFIDITERKVAAADLERSEAQFRSFSQAVPNHVWSAPPDGQLNWFNDRVYEYSGAQPGALDGVGWVDMVHPEDRQGAGERWAAALKSGDVYQTEFRLRRGDGQYRWHLARAVPIRGEAGEVVRWIGTNTDIESERVTAEALAALNETLEHRVAEQAAERDRLWRTSQDLLVVVRPDGVFQAANPAWTSVLGWSPQEVVGKTELDFLAAEDGDTSQSALVTALDRPLARYETQYRHKDGSPRWITWIASSDEGLVYATGRNVTEAKAAEADLARAQEALRQSQKMDAVGQLTGGIAHDFNNMLAVVVGSLDLLSRRLTEGDARSRRYLDAAADGARRAALLTQRLLAFSRQQPLQPEAVDANKLVAGMSDLLRHSIGADVRLETVLAGGLWRTHADPNQLENIVLNLAVNARDAMPEGGRLTIETQNTHLDERYAADHLGLTAGQFVLIAVTDTGCGMPPEIIEKAFDPFYTTKEVGKGTGLGLSQVYGFVKQSGGHVKIYSEPGHGTTIKIYLPRLKGAVLQDTAEAPNADLLRGEQREVILVVEDDPAVRQFSVDALHELGYRVLEAEGAAAALLLLDAHPEIVLMFTDVVMPDVNGAKLADEARRRRPTLKVLFTTGYTRNAVVHNGVLDEGVDLIGKPFTLEALAAKLRAVLEMV